MRTAKLLSFIGAILLATPGCLITEEIEFPNSPGRVAEGSCMCTWCLDRPFCRNAATGDTLLRDAGESCPAGFEPSVETSAVRFSDSRAGGVYCIRPDGKRLDRAEIACPEDGRADYEHLDDCIDLPPCARPAECFGPDDPPPDPIACPGVMTGPRRAVCGEHPYFDSDDIDRLREGRVLAAAEGREKLVDSCGIYGLDVPTGAEAQRYCFLSCATPLTDVVGESPLVDGCNPALDPEITHPSFVIPIHDATVQVSIRIDDDTHVGTTSGSGLVAIEAPDCGPGMSCTARIPWLRLAADDPLSIAGQTVRDLRLRCAAGVRERGCRHRLPLVSRASHAPVPARTGDPAARGGRVLDGHPTGQNRGRIQQRARGRRR